MTTTTSSVSLYSFNRFSTCWDSPNFSKFRQLQLIVRRKRSGSSSFKVFVLSAHSNPKIVKTNRRSRFGTTLSPYDSDHEDADSDFDDDDEVDDDEDDDWFSEVTLFKIVSIRKLIFPHFFYCGHSASIISFNYKF